MLNFFAYRLNLIVPNQISLFFTKSKEEHFYDLLTAQYATKKDSFVYYNSKYLIYFSKQLTPSIYAITIAKEETYTKPIEGDSTIEQVIDVRTPYIYVIIDKKRQIVLI
jgi:uncharacterized protein with ACT and thioredoxin-like domain